MNEELLDLIDAYLAGDISEAQSEFLSDQLRDDEQARAQFIRAADIHANLSVDESLWTSTGGDVIPFPTRRSRLPWKIAAVAAGLVALLSLALIFERKPADITFATMAHTSAAFWESGDLPTADGSRLGTGTLRLADGLATLHFDSGAEVTIEAPATLTLIDAMNCQLTRGTVVSDIPESALGFRVVTPSADVVDYGTRFAVSVFDDTGETTTQVMEGKVHVEYANSDKIVELETGQRNRVIGESTSGVTDEAEREYRTLPVVPLDYGEDWEILESTKDAYTGFVKGHTSEVLLCIKRAIDEGPINRVSYLGFDLNQIDRNRIAEAELSLHFAPTGWGLASSVPDATFSVYGLLGAVPEWDESILNKTFPEHDGKIHLGSFTIPQGMQKGRFGIRTEDLRAFLQDYPDTSITLKVVRDTQETDNGGLVHGFASRRHPILPAPTLAIRTTNP